MGRCRNRWRHNQDTLTSRETRQLAGQHRGPSGRGPWLWIFNRVQVQTVSQTEAVETGASV